MQYGSRPQHTAFEQATNLVKALHAVEKDGHEPYVVLLDVAKAFPSTLHAALFELLLLRCHRSNYVAAIKKVYQRTDAYCDVKGHRIHYKPTTVVKLGCPYSPLLFVYDLLLKQLIANPPNAFVYIEDIAIFVKSQEELESLFDDLSVLGSQIGIRFNPDKM